VNVLGRWGTRRLSTGSPAMNMIFDYLCDQTDSLLQGRFSSLVPKIKWIWVSFPKKFLYNLVTNVLANMITNSFFN
jgi:hypothetical protein